MKTYTTHPQPIITAARTGAPLSTLNRRKRARLNRPLALVILALVAFWAAVGILAASL